MKGNFLGILPICWTKDEVSRLFKTMVKFCQNAGALLASTTIALERAHARPHSRLENVFAKLKKKVSDENDKKCFAIRISVGNISTFD